MVINQTAEQPGDENLLGIPSDATRLGIRVPPQVLRRWCAVSCLWLLDVFPEVWPPSFLLIGQTVGPSALARKAREIRGLVLPLYSLTLYLSPLPFVWGLRKQLVTAYFLLQRQNKNSLGWELPGSPVVRTRYLAAAALPPPTLPPTKVLAFYRLYSS